jgi:hypothetical protein
MQHDSSPPLGCQKEQPMMTRIAPTDTYRAATRLLFLAALAAVLLLALLPVQKLKEFGLGFGFGSDKLNHAAAFAVLAVLGHFGWPKRIVALIALLTILGILIEALQGLPLIARDLDILDWVADCAGLTGGSAIALCARSMLGR